MENKSVEAAGATKADQAQGKTVIFYDGVCGLCNFFVKFVLSNSEEGVFAFASLQSDFADEELKKHGVNSLDLNSVYVLTEYGDPSNKALSRSDAVIHILKKLKSPYPLLATIIGIIPRPVRDFGYSMVAKFRYKIFGKHDTCLLPSSGEAEKFIDI